MDNNIISELQNRVVGYKEINKTHTVTVAGCRNSDCIGTGTTNDAVINQGGNDICVEPSEIMGPALKQPLFSVPAVASVVTRRCL